MRGLAYCETAEVISGFPDKYRTKLRFVWTTSFSLASGNPTYIQAKLNSPYRPLASAGVTTSYQNYSVMFGQYAKAHPRASRINIKTWSGVTAADDDEPLRTIVIPVTGANYTTYAGYNNISNLMGVPHARSVMYSPGGTIPDLHHYMTAATIYAGESGTDTQGSNNWSCAVNADPSNIVYWLIGFQGVAGTTTHNVQAQIEFTIYVEFYQPTATPAPSLTDFWGNDTTTCDDYKDSGKEVAKPGQKRKMSVSDMDYELVQAIKKLKT